MSLRRIIADAILEHDGYDPTFERADGWPTGVAAEADSRADRIIEALSPGIPELAIQQGANALYDGDGIPPVEASQVMAGCLTLAEDVLQAVVAAGYRILPREEPT